MTSTLDHMKAMRSTGNEQRDANKAPARPNGDEPFINDEAARGVGPKLAPAKHTNIEDLTMERVDWIWKGWIGRGILHLIAGVPEAGKTTVALSVAATLSSGERWPDKTRGTPGTVMIWTGEDSPAQTIKPRLVQMGAGKTIEIVTGQPDENAIVRPFKPATDLPGLVLAAKALPDGIDLLITDPIVAVIGSKLDTSNNAGHREKLQPLVDFAKDLNCAVLGVTHFTKGTIGKDPCDRVTVSLAFGAVARIIMVATNAAAFRCSPAPANPQGHALWRASPIGQA